LCPPPGDCVDFRWSGLILDGAFWFVLSAIIVRARIGCLALCAYFFIGVLATALIALLMVFFRIHLFFEL
jgi:hypothetical protein